MQARNAAKVSVFQNRFGFRDFHPEPTLKKIKKVSLERKFNLYSSLFTSWKVNLEDYYRKCFKADMLYSKIYKFVKDKKDLAALSELLVTNYGEILEQYMWGQGVSNYPSIDMVDFSKQCKLWGCINKKDLSVSDIDRLFVAVNFEEVQGDKQAELDDNPDKELCRYEFFEILVRMAKCKFIDNQKLKISVT